MKLSIGIDVSKLKLDVAIILSEGRILSLVFPNTPAGHRELLERTRKMAKGLPLHFCMEATGGYHLRLALFLVERCEFVSVENPRPIKYFGIVDGALQKNDRADARVIARYADVMNPGQWRLAEPHIRELVALDRRITELKVMQNQETNRLEMPCLPELVQGGILASVQGFQIQIAGLEKRIEEILNLNKELSEQVQLLVSIPGIGRRAAIGLLAEVGDLNAYKTAEDFAARIGLNPIQRKSGSSLNGKTRISKAGNAYARARLYMPTVVAIRVNPIIKDFYTKLVVLGHKPKKSALIASERKLAMICYGILKSGKPFDPCHMH